MSSTQSININRIIGRKLSDEEDILAVEEPLEIRLSFVKNSKRQESNLSVTMRTPGNDRELAIGFLFTEGIIKNYDEVISIDASIDNIVKVIFRDDVNFEMSKLEKHFYTSSSCGVCGKTSIESINTIREQTSQKDKIIFDSSVIYSLTNQLRKEQSVFEQTGGLHASALFNSIGELILLNEDVGRHNALDKLIGSSLIKKIIPLENYLLLLSGRASFELIQKATMAGINIVASVGAPSSLAVELAKERNMTLIGFLKNERFNIYCGMQRVKI